MNRDEQRSRAAALAPAIHRCDAFAAVYPSEAGGGTWIGANSRGTTLALLNWYFAEAGTLGEKSRSRGGIIPSLLSAADAAATREALEQMCLEGIHPFRLFGIFPTARTAFEWRWDTKRVDEIAHDWRRQHWFSSSWSDALAESERGKVFEENWREGAADEGAWLRAMHASHRPRPGAFSVCVHRDDAATVSYTDVECCGEGVRMRYHPGNPCHAPEQLPSWTLPAPAASPEGGENRIG